MTPEKILADLKAQGVEAWHSDGRLRYRGPQESVDAALPTLRQHRDALLALLSPPVDGSGLPDGPCPVCGSGYFWRGGHGWTCGRCAPPLPDAQETCTAPARGLRMFVTADQSRKAESTRR